MTIECPITKKVILEKAIASDGITYERKAILKYIRKYHRSPVTGESLCLKDVVFDSSYYESKEERAEKIVDTIRFEVQQCIGLKKQLANFEFIPENICIYLKKNSDKSWYCYAESTLDNNELSERILRSIQHYASAMFFCIKGDTSIYKTTHLGNGRLHIKGSDKINECSEHDKKLLSQKWSSFHKKNKMSKNG